MLSPKGLIRIPRETTPSQDSKTLIIRLKKKVETLNAVINQQQATIQALQRSCKITKINELQVEIEHLTEENRRLRGLLEEGKRKVRGSTPKQKKTAASCAKLTQRQTVALQYKFEPKTFQVFQENECLRKHLINLKVKQKTSKEKSSNFNDLSCIMLEKSVNEQEKTLQRRIDLEAEQALLRKKVKMLQEKVREITLKNQEFETKQRQHRCISPSPYQSLILQSL